MARPIERLPTQRQSNETKELMNCKNCRKRKIKCNRLKPECEACKVFKTACVYDAVPKKRGPKTDVLESLLKRVNGLERRLAHEKEANSSSSEAAESSDATQKTPEQASDNATSASPTIRAESQPAASQEQPTDPIHVEMRNSTNPPDTIPSPSAIIDTYFSRLHERPYYILDEAATRSRFAKGRLPRFLTNALCAATVRFAMHHSAGLDLSTQACKDYAERARAEIDNDEPSIDHIQAFLLLSMAYFQIGRGKKSYMLLSHATTMVYALELHRELPSHLTVPQLEREGRRKLFWTCYLMERVTTTGSHRPSLIADEVISLRLPAWRTAAAQQWSDGSFFPNSSNNFSSSGSSSLAQGPGATLVDITRILGVANKFLLLGGVKNDSHFPWHAQSTVSKIRQDLDAWAARTQETFSSPDLLFRQPESPTYLLSKLIYHLIHCLIYRPFLPVTLTDLSGSSAHQSWQIETMKLVFAHADAIVQLVECARSSGVVDWPPFVVHCVFVAATVHIHGSQYVEGNEGHLFGQSRACLARAMSLLQDFRSLWTGAEHQRDTLQTLHAAHAQLMQAVGSGSIALPSVFHMERFLDRYPGVNVDEAYNPLRDVSADVSQQAGFRGNTSHQHSVSTGVNPQNRRPAVHRSNTATSSSNEHSHSHFPRPIDTLQPSYPTPTSASVPDSEFDPSNPHNHLRLVTSHSSSHAPQPQLYKEPEFTTPTFHDYTTNDYNNHNPFHHQSLPHHSASPAFAFSPLSRGCFNGGNGGGNGGEGAFFMDEDPRHDSFLDGRSASGVENSATSPREDPFLSLLEELAANEDFHQGAGSFGEMDFGMQ